jgi:SWI/SNF-related matrix-associated actin-dependent regulator 1 of chromatin subfamily A
MSKEKISSIVKIKKLSGGANFRVTYDYMPIITEYIKNNIPREQWKTHVENTVINGQAKDIWSRDVRAFSIGKLISFFLDNGIIFQFENMNNQEIDVLRNEYKLRQNRLKMILKEKVEGLDTTGMDFSFMKIPPYDYQKSAVKFFEMNEGNALLGDQPGIGKTLSLISYAVKNNLKTLVVVPASLKINWKKEVENFTHEKAYIYKYNPPKSSKYQNNEKEESLFHVINYESLDTFLKFEYKHKCSTAKCNFNVTNLEKKYDKCPHCHTPKSVKSKIGDIVYIMDKNGDKLDPDEYDLIALDEAHYIKNENAQRTKIIRRGFKDVKNKILISGTPIKNRVFEMFSLLNFLRPTQFNNSYQFAIKYCAGYENSFGLVTTGASNLEELYETLSPFMLRRLKSDLLSLPPKTYITIPIELSDKQRKDYKKLEEGVIEQLQGDMVDANGEKKNALAIMLDLKRFTSEVKMKESIQIIQDLIDQDEKVVIFSEFQNTAEYIKNYFKEKAVLIHGQVSLDDRNNAVEAFQRSDSDVMVFSGTIGAAGVGLTLTRSSTLIFIGKSYDPGGVEQAEDRVHRNGSKANKITIMTLICENTIDEHIESIIYNKSLIVNKVIDNKIDKKNIDILDFGNTETTNRGSFTKQLIEKIMENSK